MQNIVLLTAGMIALTAAAVLPNEADPCAAGSAAIQTLSGEYTLSCPGTCDTEDDCIKSNGNEIGGIGAYKYCGCDDPSRTESDCCQVILVLDANDEFREVMPRGICSSDEEDDCYINGKTVCRLTGTGGPSEPWVRNCIETTTPGE